MAENQLDEILRTAGSRPYRDFVEYHYRRHSAKHHREALFGEVALLPGPVKEGWESFTDYLRAYPGWDIPLWYEATVSEAFDKIVESAMLTLPLKGVIDSLSDARTPENHDLALGLFQIATLTFAISASLESDRRKFMGIKKKGLFG